MLTNHKQYGKMKKMQLFWGRYLAVFQYDLYLPIFAGGIVLLLCIIQMVQKITEYLPTDRKSSLLCLGRTEVRADHDRIHFFQLASRPVGGSVQRK
jgi:hypothetical protein